MTPRQFDQMYRMHSHRLLKIAWHLTGSKHDAEDAVQETFLRALRAVEYHYDERSAAGAWLTTILINFIRESGRRATLMREKIQPELVQTAHPESSTSSAENVLLLDETIRRTWAALQQIPESFRETLILRHVDGKPAREIAGILGIDSATVRSRARRAREMILRILDGDKAV